ncbi:sucrose transport protein, putative [Pediculus humanus corporis]|uniref:Sucrose transport protein, putative n=1 Tax=Pediculus humanus subsp. corporis TaxID=121224 RepID=E0W3L9_PEDHC|nr:sucrose transport protein, putative [Pediculus humanus corporis]EEB20225.1 sucrose transport protein, putative [Pediculus humanus corporis]
MVDKLYKYEGGLYGRLHDVRDKARERIKQWREEHPKSVRDIALNMIKPKQKMDEDKTLDEYDHIYRKKTTSELIRISAAVMGIEFSYAAETAFVSPILLKIGVQHEHMTMVWALSPILGFLITPILGSLSDGSRLSMGRRRPFILLLALGVLMGLILVPNGEDFGLALGDFDFYSNLTNRTQYPIKNILSSKEVTKPENSYSNQQYSHPWGIFFTVLGTVLLDFDADSCQSPARAYLLDVSLPQDHARGLSTFTVMAGLGGFFGYALGGVNWDVTAIGKYLGGHIRTVFTFITFLFIICISCTVTSFKEIPLNFLQEQKKKHLKKLAEVKTQEGLKISDVEVLTYGTIKDSYLDVEESRGHGPGVNDQLEQIITDDVGKVVDSSSNLEIPSLKEYLLSIVFMPKSLKMICLTNLFCWMSHVCYSLYFTDFVGEAVFNGNPLAPQDSQEYKLYEEGVRFGCWGMSMYSLSCSCYSLIIEGLIKRFKAKKVYVGGLLFYSFGMFLMAVTKDKIGVILFSWTAGVMYSTLFTLPYLLVAHYHSNGVFELTKDGEVKHNSRQRGLGTDVGIVSSMVFLAQFTLALGMGEIVSWTGTTTAVVSAASVLAFCGAVTATRVMYLDL